MKCIKVILSLLSLCLVLMSCDETALELIDCIINKEAELPDRELKHGLVSQYYYDELKGSINNEPDDDAYFYDFNVKGSLPEGIEIRKDGRFLVFEGETLHKGSFNLQVMLSVDPFDEIDNDINFCPIGSTSREYTLIILD